MNYEEAVKQKIAKQKQQGIISEPIIFNEKKISDHEFSQSFMIQDNFEQRSFLGFNYKKHIGQKNIPMGLCAVCNKLEIEHIC